MKRNRYILFSNNAFANKNIRQKIKKRVSNLKTQIDSILNRKFPLRFLSQFPFSALNRFKTSYLPFYGCNV